MNEELSQIDADLKGFFVEGDMDSMADLLREQSDAVVMELCDYNWSIILKYYDNKNFELLFRHIKFVAYTCFMMEYAHQSGILKEDEFISRMMVYQSIYDLKQQQV